MRVGMYNRWLATLGGGEQLSLSIAEYISKFYPITVISHKNVSRELASERLGLDLSRVEFLSIPERPAPEMTPITEDYDFFICSSFMDYFPSHAPISAALIYFPAPTDSEPVMRFRRRVKLATRRALMVPAFIDGVINIVPEKTSQLRWLDSSVTVRLPASTKPYHCSFNIAAHDAKINHIQITLNNEPASIIELPINQNFVHHQMVIPATSKLGFQEIGIQAPEIDATLPDGSIRMLMKDFLIDRPRYRIYNVFFERWFKSYGQRLHYVPPGVYSIIDSMDTYSTIWSISKFSQKWIKNYWDRSSEILYPPVNIDNFQTGVKQNKILSVGRFFTGSHNKKHDILLQAFRDMVDQGLSGWELHLAGGSTPGKIHEDYLNTIKRQAEGYPVFIHVDIAFSDLVKLYSDSAIYWHASGYGEDENLEPIKFEHFGITTVEAMASGCVPVVIGKGGQPEIVQHGKNGYLWNKPDELKKLTLELIGDNNLRERMAVSALEQSTNYSKVNFINRLHMLLEHIEVL